MMASIGRMARAGTRGFRAWSGASQMGRRFSSASVRSVRQVGVGVGVVLAGSLAAYGVSRLYQKEEGGLVAILPRVMAAGTTPQPSVYAENKTHSVYIWVHLKPTANIKECARVAATLQDKVVKVTGANPDDDDEVFAGVGFGCNFYKQATAGTGAPEDFSYPFRKGYLGDMPSTGGDIFVHAKSNNYSKLYELTQLFIRSFPAGAIDKAKDIYGWTYQEGRDLSGFIDGTENPAEEDDRLHVAVNNGCGGSYCVTQRWIHDHDVIQNTKDRTLENWVGRGKPDSVEQTRKTPSSHVARMVGTPTPGQPKPFEMVRHSQPYGTVCGESGLFFIGYAASVKNLNFMLDRMVGADKDGLCDDVMRLTRCVTGTFWYFPSEENLKKLA